jgi:isopenicillin-N N-acyltransferase-like protein
MKMNSTMAMDRRSFIASLAAMGLTACVAPSRVTIPGPTPPPPFPELEARGAAADLGVAHGRAFPGQIRDNLAFYKKWLSESGKTTEDRLTEIAAGFRPVLGEHFPLILEEIDGIARGAQLPADDVLLINARTDILAIVEAELAERKIPACTALALHGSRHGRPALTLSQNWDWDPLLAKAPVILRLRPKVGPAIVTLVEAGMTGKIGFNEHRLGVCLNFLGHVTDGQEGRFGVPIHCLLRAVQNCSSMEEAVATVRAAPRCASANFLLARHDDGVPQAFDLEISPDAVATLRSDGSDLVHTNHFLDPELTRGCTSGFGPSTMKRYARAEGLLAELGESEPDPVERAKRVLESRADLPYPISRHHNPDPSSSTLAGIIMDLTGNRLILTRGAPHLSEWVERPGV